MLHRQALGATLTSARCSDSSMDCSRSRQARSWLVADLASWEGKGVCSCEVVACVSHKRLALVSVPQGQLQGDAADQKSQAIGGGALAVVTILKSQALARVDGPRFACAPDPVCAVCELLVTAAGFWTRASPPQLQRLLQLAAVAVVQSGLAREVLGVPVELEVVALAGCLDPAATPHYWRPSHVWRRTTKCRAQPPLQRWKKKKK